MNLYTLWLKNAQTMACYNDDVYVNRFR